MHGVSGVNKTVGQVDSKKCDLQIELTGEMKQPRKT